MTPPPPLSDLSDQEVVALALQRRQGAYAELVRRYGEPVHRLISGYVDTDERAEELAQDTFFKVAMFLGNYRPENSLAAWILTIARHTAIDYVRSRPPDSATAPWSVTPSAIDRRAARVANPLDMPTPDPGTPRLRAAVEDALSQLKPVPRECFVLHVMEQRTYEDIARTLNLPVGTVKSHVNRAHKKLRTLLSPLLDSSDPDLTA